jgi:parallel beta-helix repeat protein
MKRWFQLLVLVCVIGPGAAPGAPAAALYVRQTVGDDTNDGRSPATAWRGLSRLSTTLRAGDTAYVGPGLYRERLVVAHHGTADRPITVIGDETGQHTGDPPGPVMIAGSDPVDEAIFTPHDSPGVYTAPIAARDGVVEMDGPQYRYTAAGITTMHLREDVPELEVVARQPSTYVHDAETNTLYLHTSDGLPPSTHELEVVRRTNGIFIGGRTFVRVMGFTVRHAGDAGINFYRGSRGGVAFGNTLYGNHEGIRAYGTEDVTIYGNTLLRNQDAGVYFALRSVHGRVIGNVSYDNMKGLRWSSESGHGLAIDNVLFDNHRYGLAVEHSDGVILIGNRVDGNGDAQLMVTSSEYASFNNCFHAAGQQLTALFVIPRHSYGRLAQYQQEQDHDAGSREGDCGPLPARVDVRALHREATTYVERARKLRGVSGDLPPPASAR